MQSELWVEGAGNGPKHPLSLLSCQHSRPTHLGLGHQETSRAHTGPDLPQPRSGASQQLSPPACLEQRPLFSQECTAGDGHHPSPSASPSLASQRPPSVPGKEGVPNVTALGYFLLSSVKGTCSYVWQFAHKSLQSEVHFQS